MEDRSSRGMQIEGLIQSTVPSSSPIQDLNVKIVKIYDTNNVKLTLNGTCLYMKPTTVLFFIDYLLYNVLNMYSIELSQYM